MLCLYNSSYLYILFDDSPALTNILIRFTYKWWENVKSVLILAEIISPVITFFHCFLQPGAAPLPCCFRFTLAELQQLELFPDSSQDDGLSTTPRAPSKTNDL